MQKPPLLAKSAFNKLERAKEQIDQLDMEITGWLRSSHRVTTKSYPDVRQVCQYVRQVALPHEHWPVLAGEAVHNLRAALDHLVWGLTVYHQRRMPAEPVPLKCDWRRIAFPIHLRAPTAWPPRALWGVHPGLIDRFRDEQPFQMRKSPDTERDELWVLHELRNRDKHRSLFEIESALRGRSNLTPEERVLLATFGDKEFPDVRLQEITHRDFRPLEYGQAREVLCLRFAEMPDEYTVEAYMKRRSQLVVDVTFDEGAPAFGKPVRQLMRSMHDRVRGILGRFAPEFDPPKHIAQSRDHCPPPTRRPGANRS